MLRFHSFIQTDFVETASNKNEQNVCLFNSDEMLIPAKLINRLVSNITVVYKQKQVSKSMIYGTENSTKHFRSWR